MATFSVNPNAKTVQFICCSILMCSQTHQTPFSHLARLLPLQQRLYHTPLSHFAVFLPKKHVHVTEHLTVIT